MKIRHRAAVVAAVAGIAVTGAIPALAGPALAGPALAGPALATTGAGTPKPAAGTATVFSADGTLAALSGLRLSLTGDNGRTAVTVDPKAAVTLDGNTAKLVALPLGARVKLSGNTTDGVSVATRVDASSVRPFVAAGSVSGVDLEDKTVSVTPLLGSDRTARSYPVAPAASITLDGRKVALSALPAGAHIVVLGSVIGCQVYSAKSLTALSRWDLKLSGTVSAVDAAKGVVTVDADGAAVKLDVAPNATIKVNGARATLAGLPIGAAVNLTGTGSTRGSVVSGITAKVKI
ncbi:hypothetical protein GCM10010172_34100 [Paractinoplanes ferrugineus]|uniref:DUF5666 domain-containing protein n=1 Tax=Paractinoplanes ferrugineus TaxID=113564 RepID=A0A919MH79_9ACTN|nr:hypothetical protein [Actinoplanes ferrugineus]GIE14659.1 hypothetical protein Afe05nite_64990 [Actinoplanes ferrugineus]